MSNDDVPDGWTAWLPATRWSPDDLHKRLEEERWRSLYYCVTPEMRPRCQYVDEDGERCTEYEHTRRNHHDDGHRYGGPHGVPTWTDR